MSDRKPTTEAVTFEAVRNKVPGDGWLIFGVIYPAAVVASELATGMCASSFFDPMPTWGHAAAAASVPAANLLVWWHLRRRPDRRTRLMVLVSGFGIIVAAFYAFVFLPLTPLAIIAVPFGIGLLPLAPIASFIAAVRFALLLADMSARGIAKPLVGGMVAGVLAFLSLDIVPDATRRGITLAASDAPAERARGLWLLRHLGDKDLLLRMCYGIGGAPIGLISAAQAVGDGIMFGRPRRQTIAPAMAREVYYRAYGVPFNTQPVPGRQRRSAEFARLDNDQDLGGTQVGGRVAGLDLVSSRMDGSVSGDDAVAYLEWVFTFRNTSPLPQEARLQLALPPGAVVSRATLWVNGEEREAAYGGKGEVRAAYQQVAVRQRQDPLLVTTNGADRVLAQAFPVPASGGNIQFKIGITAPLALDGPDRASLVLPAVVDRNFSFGEEARHGIWLEGRQALASGIPGLSLERTAGGAFRLTGTLDDRALTGARPRIDVARSGAATRRVARLGDGAPVVQEMVEAAPAGGTLMLVIDGSVRLAPVRTALIKALDAIPPQARVGVVLAAEDVRQVAPAPWTGQQKLAVTDIIRSAGFTGGQDNAPALAAAMQALEAEPAATLLWIHGPQPVRFPATQSRVDQVETRLARLPEVRLYEVEAGPNELLSHGLWPRRARSIPRGENVGADLTAILAGHWSDARRPMLRRQTADTVEGIEAGSQHIARLWAHDRVLDLSRPQAGQHADAVALATAYRLVTPVSGAVVLETQRQYDQHGLRPVDQTSVPTVPEPHEWALILIVGALLLRFAWQQRARMVAA